MKRQKQFGLHVAGRWVAALFLLLGVGQAPRAAAQAAAPTPEPAPAGAPAPAPVVAVATPGVTEQKTAGSPDVTTSVTRMGLKTFSRLLAKAGPKAENVAISPVSLETAMAMLALGARGTTRRELDDFLGLPTGEDQARDWCRALGGSLTGLAGEGVSLDVARGSWAQKGFPFKAEFGAAVKELFGAEARELDFGAHPEEARGEINAWASKATSGKVPVLVPPKGIDKLTRLVLTDAVSFVGKWAEPFSPKLTAPAPFHPASGPAVEVPTMHRHALLAYAESERWQALVLPYKGERLGMLVLLPRPESSTAKALDELGKSGLGPVVEAMKTVDVDVALPKFSVESTLDAASLLLELGVKEVFSDADLSGLTESKGLALKHVFHAVRVEVGEEGTVAAAATAAVVGGRGFSVATQMRVDRPFLFAVVDLKSRLPLFLGQVGRPTAAASVSAAKGGK